MGPKVSLVTRRWANKKISKLIGTLADVLQHPDVPFTHFARVFDSEPSGHKLHDIYIDLYNAAKTAVERFVATHPERLKLHSVGEGDLPISYNLAMTTSGMVILPRQSEGTMLRHDDGREIGFIALNGTTLGGTMMVKYEEEWDLLRKKPEILQKILAAIGIPKESQWSKPHV